MSATVYKNVFTKDEIDQLISFYNTLPIASNKTLDSQLLRVIKHSAYNFEDLTPYKILNPKLAKQAVVLWS